MSVKEVYKTMIESVKENKQNDIEEREIKEIIDVDLYRDENGKIIKMVRKDTGESIEL